MTTKSSSINRTRWLSSALCTLILLFSLGVGQMWGTEYFSDALAVTGNSSVSSRSGWSSLSRCYGHYGSAIRLGTSSNSGSITKTAMAAIGSTPTDIVLRFSAKKWSTDAVGLNITVNNAGTANITNITLPAKQATTNAAFSWDEKDYYEIIITGATSSTTITFATSASKRILLGNVSISSASDDTYRFKLVENAKDIGAGDYLIVYNNTNALNNHSGNVDANTYATYTDISSYYTAGTKSFAYNSTTEALVYKAYTTTNGYALRKAYSGEFLGYASASTGAFLRWDNTFTTTNDEWDLGVNSIVACYNSKTNAIRWYNTSGQYRFAIYGKAAQSAVQLFKKEVVPAATVNVTGVTVDPTSKAILVGETFTITPTVSPADATDKSVSWSSSASGKASVNSSGVVTGVAAGTANITCTTTDGSFTATCATTVYSASVTSIVDEDGTDISSSGVTATISGRTLTASEGSTKYKFKTWKYGTASGTSISSATSLSTSLTGTPTGNVTLIAEFYKPVEVAWTKGGTTYSTGSPTTSVKRGTQWKDLTIPTAPGDASLGSCADKFMGWSNCSDLIGTGHSAPGVLFTSVSGITTEITAPIEFKAVFAKASAGGSGNIQLSYTSLSLTTSYESGSTKAVSDVDFYCNDVMTGSSGSDGYQKIQFKKSSTGPGYIYNSEILPGNITSIVFGSTTRNMTVNFGTSSNPDGSTETTTCSSSSLTATPTGNYKYFKILNATDNAAYTGTITINYSSVSYSNYVTQCCTELGSINGSIY